MHEEIKKGLIMIVHLKSQNVDTSNFEIAVELLKSSLVDASIVLINKLIHKIESQEAALQENFNYYQDNRSLLLDTENITKECNRLDRASKVYKSLLNKVVQYKDVNQNFMNLYNALDTYYTSLITVPIELSFLEAQMIDDGEMQSAS